MYRYTLTCNNDATSEVLGRSPIGWDEKGYSFQENEVYHGVLSEFTIQKLGFTRDKKTKKGGLNFILSKYEVYGVEADLEILIEYINTSTNAYVTWANCRLSWLDSPEQQYNIDDDAMYMKLTDTSDRERFRENDELDVDILSSEDLQGNSITLNQFDIITLTPQELFKEYKSNSDNDSGERLLTETGDYSTNSSGIVVNTIGDSISIDGVVKKIYTNETGDTAVVKIKMTDVESIIDLNLFTDSHGQTGNLDVIFTFKIYRRNSSSALISTTVIDAYNELINFTTSYSGQITRNYDYETEYTLADGDYIELYATVSFVIGTDIDTADSTWNLSHTYEFQLLEKTSLYDYNVDIDGIAAHEAFENILQIITGNTSPLYSPILGRTDIGYAEDGFMGLVCITNGKLIRQMPASIGRLTLSFKKLFQSFNSISPIYLGYDDVNGRFVIDSIENRYLDDTIYTIDNPASFKRMFSHELYFNSIKAGQKNKVEYEIYNGVEEAMTPYDFGTSLPFKNTYDAASPYNLDPTGIEVQRRKLYSGTGTQDEKNDGNVYLIRVERSGIKFLSKRLQPGEEAINIYNASTRLNLEFTAKRNLIRHGRIISSIYHKNILGKFKYLSSQLKSDMGTKLSGETSFIYEGTDIDVSDLDERFFIPELIEFEYPIDNNLLTLIKNNPHKLFRVNTDIGIFFGFISKKGVRTNAYDRTGNWVLLVYGYIPPPILSDLYKNRLDFRFDFNSQYIPLL